jgi:cupin 2 domain-containing protein
MTTKNFFGELPRHLPHELFTIQLDDANVRIERIVPHGHALPEQFWYDQDE